MHAGRKLQGVDRGRRTIVSDVLRLLMVEDSPVDAKLIVAALRKGGRVIEFDRVDSADALRAALRNATYDVLTCDWSMPGFDAPAALAVVKETGIDIPFIIVSGTVGEELAVDAMHAGAHDYVIKDRLARLAPAVERELREVKVRAAQRQATAALLASEERYRRIIENTNQGVWVIDAEGKTTFLNERMAQLLGSTVAQVIGRSPDDFLDDEGREHLSAAIELHKVGKSRQNEVRLVRADGSVISVLLETSPILDDAGQHGAFAMVMDITDRKRAESSLRISEARFRSLWESGIILISIFTLDGKIVDVNDALARALGYSRDELLSGRIQWPDLTSAEWLETEGAAFAQLAARGVAAAWEKELIAKDGARVPILAGAVILEGAEGIEIGIDLSERKRVDKALYERLKSAALTADVGISLAHQDTLRAMLQTCSEAIVKNLGAALARIWTLDADATVLELQASAGLYTRLDGGHARVPVGQFKIGRIAEEREPHLTNSVLNDPRIGDPAWAAQERLVAFAGYPLIAGGDLVGVVAMFSREPLTEAALEGLRTIADAIAVGIRRNRAEAAKESLEAQLRQAQKLEAIGSLAGGVAHDFNNILSVILSYSEFIKSDLPPGHALVADAEEINTAALRAAGLTRQLLAFSRRQVLQPRVLNLNEVVRDMKSMLRRLLSEDIELAIVVDPTTGNVNADPGQIEQVLMNLLVNARDAMPQGGSVTIETANVMLDAAFAAEHVGVTPGPHTMLSVTDTGHGMDAMVRARIFEPFFTTKETGRGTGLGLSTVFGIIRQSNGTIWVDSTVGVGTSFKVYLPNVTANVRATKAPQQAARGGNELILLCEDEDPVRSLVRAILTRNGYRVLEARNGGEALMLFEQHAAIDLLVTDVVMPVMSGRQLAERLGAIRPDLKVLYMSGYTDDAIVRHGVLKDEIELLQKPITPDVLARRVRAVLDAPPRVR
jgi:two-component system cell cycle sensor histidine kinase/response regulator CckA